MENNNLPEKCRGIKRPFKLSEDELTAVQRQYGDIFEKIWDSLQPKFHKDFAEKLIYGTSTIDYTEEVELLKQTKDE